MIHMMGQRSWHPGQKNVERPACVMRRILAPQRRHFSPSRSYTRQFVVRSLIQ